ncbi:NADH:flavin oxidoreductase/NADH oxidase family protein [Candidatus Uabimicrobium amorphum]|uniref:NADH oxidase n=1 Tax=Uabimicrobium amorphum TaxID=2596890 RepID=A0A5S9F2Q0_UABAM|nr:NADH:flavin oxidoreductase/NADH oxidase family protein [Candidatus Uabimicrobium amorphum]BBM82594.1 NADH oxidase [Candidatus Uabimicrobium amorphum]
MDYANILGKELKLANGCTIKNRFMKSAMSEVLGSPKYAPTARHFKLYETWAQGGTGLLFTGNVMVDSRYMGEPGNVVVEDDEHMDALRVWAKSGTANGTQLWMQINHPGKQIPNFLCKEPVAPSAIPLALPMFNKPRALTGEEIRDTIRRFAKTAAIAKEAGFTGVQIHGAHGYLVSQFLSPLHNERQDEWGGSLENRMRFLVEIYQAMRESVGEKFPISIKLNSADFQRGGFSEEESLQVIEKISQMGMDLIEVSGGTYEAQAMTGKKKKESTKQREAYFLEFAEKVREITDVPIAVTGGFRTAKGMAEAIASNKVDLVGLARPLAVFTDIPNRILGGEDFSCELPESVKTGLKFIDNLSMLDLTWYEIQLARIGQGKKPKPNMGAWSALARTMLGVGWKNLRRRRG